MDLALAAESQDLMTDAWRSSRLNFMEMAKQIESCPTTPIVQFALCQNSQNCALTSIHITQHREPQVNELQSTKHNHNWS